MRVDGELHAEGPGGLVIIDGRGSTVDVTVKGIPHRPSRRQLARLAHVARDRGLLIRINDGGGHRLAELGGATSSLLGRALIGSGAVKPHLRAVTALRRLGG